MVPYQLRVTNPNENEWREEAISSHLILLYSVIKLHSWRKLLSVIELHNQSTLRLWCSPNPNSVILKSFVIRVDLTQSQLSQIKQHHRE